jgi:hypothetical protein
MSAYPQTNENATAVLSLQSTGHPDTDYEPALSLGTLTLDEQIEAEPPPGWEAEMEQWELERAEKAVEDAHAERAAEAAAYVRERVAGVAGVRVTRERAEYFTSDGRRILSWEYWVSGCAGGKVLAQAKGGSYMEAAERAVDKARETAARAAKGAA